MRRDNGLARISRWDSMACTECSQWNRSNDCDSRRMMKTSGASALLIEALKR